jgi:hypothetical protein
MGISDITKALNSESAPAIAIMERILTFIEKILK